MLAPASTVAIKSTSTVLFLDRYSSHGSIVELMAVPIVRTINQKSEGIQPIGDG